MFGFSIPVFTALTTGSKSSGDDGWILNLGAWRDSGTWIDTDTWKDS